MFWFASGLQLPNWKRWMILFVRWYNNQRHTPQSESWFSIASKPAIINLATHVAKTPDTQHMTQHQSSHLNTHRSNSSFSRRHQPFRHREYRAQGSRSHEAKQNKANPERHRAQAANHRSKSDHGVHIDRHPWMRLGPNPVGDVRRRRARDAVLIEGRVRGRIESKQLELEAFERRLG